MTLISNGSSTSVQRADLFTPRPKLVRSHTGISEELMAAIEKISAPPVTPQTTPRNVSKEIYCIPALGIESLQDIESGRQKFLGRISEKFIQTIVAKFPTAQEQKLLLQLHSDDGRQALLCEIISKESFPSFEEMLKVKGLQNVFPRLLESPETKFITKEGTNKAAVAIGIKFLKSRN